jgi:molybdate transport system substrate-binding protein
LNAIVSRRCAPVVRRAVAVVALLATAACASAVEVQVAVAANFAEPMKAIAAVFEKTTGHKALLTFGATGKFHAQILNGAPFDVFLAANQESPTALEAANVVVPGSRVTYAQGKLALWSADPKLVDAQGHVLSSGAFRKLAIASPKAAPYGAAAVETLKALGQWATLEPRLVQGESIGQAYAFIATGNAELGFVALSQVLEGGRLKSGSMWLVPPTLYKPIRQDAVLLRKGEGNPAARELLALLKSPRIRDLVRSYGYEL